MKTYALVLAVALSGLFLMSGTAQARPWVYVHGPYVRPHVVVRAVDPFIAPVILPLGAPEVVVGPRGHLHYVNAI
jgi:hypothetical protein